MLIDCHQLIFAMQLPLHEAGQLLLVTGIAFAVITLISSTHRFHHMIQLSEEDLPNVQSRNDFFFIQITRYLSKINRQASGFGLFIIQFKTGSADLINTQEHLLSKLKEDVRSSSIDKLCMVREDCIGAIFDTEEVNLEILATRLIQTVRNIIKTLPEIDAFRIGASSFPANGINTQVIIDAAYHALEKANFEDETPLCIATPLVSETEDNAEMPVKSGEISKVESSSILDPLTGVLKPSLIGSYMRKYLAEIRQKKNPSSVLCIGINKLDGIRELHGDDACHTVIAGVSQIIQKLTRDSDLIGRYEKEAFVILLTGSLDQGELIAHRLRDAVNKEVFISNNHRIKTSISIGVSALPEHGRYLRDLFSKAHRALEVVREWNTSSCLVYDAAQHDKKGNS